MVQMMFECPTTGELLTSTRRFLRWDGGEDKLVSLHCPKCSTTHALRRADAVLILAEERPRVAKP